MNDDTDDRLSDAGTDSRRAFVKKGALASGVVGFGSSRGFTTARGSGETGETTEATGAAELVGKALMFNDEFRPGARFRVVSPVIDETPDVEAVEEKNIWGGTNTRVIEYLNTNEEVSFFPVHDAQVEQGETYEFSPHDLSLYHDDEGIVSVEFLRPSDGDDREVGEFDVTEGGGKALMRMNDFFPGAPFRIVSGVVDWTPDGPVEGSDLFVDYNTRFGEYLNSSDEFLVYPAHAAEVDRGAVYVARDEFDVTEPAGRLITVTLDRVDEDTVTEG